MTRLQGSCKPNHPSRSPPHPSSRRRCLVRFSADVQSLDHCQTLSAADVCQHGHLAKRLPRRIPWPVTQSVSGVSSDGQRRIRTGRESNVSAVSHERGEEASEEC